MYHANEQLLPQAIPQTVHSVETDAGSNIWLLRHHPLNDALIGMHCIYATVECAQEPKAE